ncbi:hypothetical protein BWQ96_07876 [Gracilariopsis chorda]|uniref:Uncharacterized protein n=1 Tax=Gracilariopsis chorda TaxID=448386 RepID=A0A2V3IJT3_9FLOR|nr:hypothetical protein BWQ96_07876 [Gracilariopsis chorda]|eukprot:PXF42356.1 hypothetical protein BWQ96_07876 [Gracilariopsis chorda]
MSVEALRDKLSEREAKLDGLRAKLKAAKERAARPKPKSTISSIQQRYLSAIAESEDKEVHKPQIRASTNAVSSLASRWNQGIEERKVEKTRVSVRGNVSGAKKNFVHNDAHVVGKSVAKLVADVDRGPAEIEVEDDSHIPSWAKNQQKLVIKKENARSSVRVDVKELQGSVLMNAARDGSEAERTNKVEHVGNVKAALAMWGKTADEDAKVLAKKKEEEERQRRLDEKLRKEREAEERARVIKAAVEKFAQMQLSDMTDEPSQELEIIPFLERKITLVEKEIKKVEDEIAQVEASL